MTLTTISQADLTKNPQEVVDRVQRGEVTVVERSGQEQVVLLDPLDFRLLKLSRSARWVTMSALRKRKIPMPRLCERIWPARSASGRPPSFWACTVWNCRRGSPARDSPSPGSGFPRKEAQSEIAAALKFD